MTTATDRDALDHECDLIMKGGITSGIVYPPAIAEIAVDHRLRNIGGSSAGAIAAAAAAAAEVGRGSATGGFARLAALPEEMAVADDRGRTRLRRLFQAQPVTAELFDLFWSARSSSGARRAVEVSGRLATIGLRRVWVMLAGAVAVTGAVFLLALAVAEGPGFAVVTAALLVAAVILLWLASVVVVGARRLWLDAPDAVAANHMGLCNGRTVDGSGHVGLTDWLHEQIQVLAGRHDDGVPEAERRRPVTYGDLEAAGVGLVTMTTNLTQGSGDVFPFARSGWAFDPADIDVLFPADVATHLVEHGRRVTVDETDRRQALDDRGLVALPDAADLPILLGARLSLSFPILLSAVPLYSWLPVRLGDGWTMSYVKCWLSDGGITSNLPVHLFDAPLPTRPTYGINLAGGGDPARPDASNVRRPLGANRGFQPPAGRIAGPLDLLSRVFDTMQNWSDNSLMNMTGYRERICTIALGEGEGGMNLDMSTETMLGMVGRGRLAGANLAWIRRGRYDGDPPPGFSDEQLAHQWDRHRFTRFRWFLGGMGRYLDAARTGYDRGGYEQLGADPAQSAYLPYLDDWSTARRERVAASLQRIFGEDRPDLIAGSPRQADLGVATRSTGRPATADDRAG